MTVDHQSANLSFGLRVDWSVSLKKIGAVRSFKSETFI